MPPTDLPTNERLAAVAGATLVALLTLAAEALLAAVVAVVVAGAALQAGANLVLAAGAALVAFLGTLWAQVWFGARKVRAKMAVDKAASAAKVDTEALVDVDWTVQPVSWGAGNVAPEAMELTLARPDGVHLRFRRWGPPTVWRDGRQVPLPVTDPVTDGDGRVYDGTVPGWTKGAAS